MNSKGATVCTQDGESQLEMPEKGGHTASYHNLISAIEEDTPLIADTIDGLRSIEILDAALKSRESGKREKVVLHQ